MSASFIAHLTPAMPGLLAAVGLLIPSLLIVLWVTLRSARGKVEADSSSRQAASAVEAPRPKGKLSAELARLAPSLDLRVSFSRASKFLRSSVAGRDYRYQIPWLLLVGETRSGKTTLLKSSDLSFSGQCHDFRVEHSIQWCFFNYGILLDVPGQYFLDTGSLSADERKWQQVLRLLQKYRSRRPIDGLILTIASEELLRAAEEDLSALRCRAQFIYEKLWRMQKTLGLCFPVYVIVTQCDRIGGFKSFCRHLPRARQQDIFGWSSPYHLEAAFMPAWIDEAFASLSGDLHRLQSEIFLESHHAGDFDEVFLFPSQFQAICPPLKVYLEQLFKPTAYRESFRFRGLYFCGDASAEPPETVPALLAEGGRADPTPDESLELASAGAATIPGVEISPHASIFLTHLFEDKIFPESNLVRPFLKAFLSRSRTAAAAQILSVVMTVLLGAGLWSSYKSLLHRRDQSLLPTLRLVVDDLDHLQNASIGVPEDLSDDAYDLLYSMAAIGKRSFSSCFMPGSWFGSINNKIAGAMIPAFEQEVLRTLRIGLENRAKRLTRVSAAPGAVLADPPDTAAPALVSVKELPQYQQLQHFVQDLNTLQQNIHRYDAIAQPGRGDPEDLRLLLNYLNDRALPSNFDYEGNVLFRRALQDSVGQPFEYLPADKQQASETMKHLVANLFTAYIEHNIVVNSVDSLQGEIIALQQGRIQRYQDLEGLLTSIQQVKSLLSNPECAWMGSDGVALSGPMNQVTEAAIRRSDFFTASLAAYVQDTWENSFQNLRANLSMQQTGLTGPLLQWGNGKVQLTPDVDKLELALGNALNLPFIAANNQGTMTTQHPAGTQLMWDKDPLQQAASLSESYDRFIGEGMRDCPLALRNALRQVALNRLEVNMTGLAGQAETFQPVPEGASELSWQENVVPEVKNFEEASGPLVQLLGAFQALGLDDARAELLRLTESQVFGLLETLDQELNLDQPYGIRGGNFNGWDGQERPSWAAFDVHSPAELTGYLTFQRQRFKSFASDAAPLIRFLDDVGVPSASQTQARLFLKWKQIITDFDHYDGKIPGNSVAALDDFILAGMDKITPPNSCPVEPATGSTAPSSDYFIQVRNSLQQSLAARCAVLADWDAYQTYTAMARLFNQTLAGKFPFCPIASERPSDEADPGAIQNFYRLFDRNGNATIAALKRTDKFGNSRESALVFLGQMKTLRPAFASFLPGGVGAEVPVFDIMAYFRVNQTGEVAGNQILTWRLEVGDHQFDYHGLDQPGRWRFGDPLRLVLGWAKDSPLIPVAKGNQPDLTINDRDVVYRYTDNWSLLTLLMSHEAPPVAFPQFIDLDPYTLEFVIATTQDLATAPKQTASARHAAWPVPSATPATTVFIRVNIMPAGKRQILRLPDFPASAPPLQQTSALSQ